MNIGFINTKYRMYKNIEKLVHIYGEKKNNIIIIMLIKKTSKRATINDSLNITSCTQFRCLRKAPFLKSCEKKIIYQFR